MEDKGEGEQGKKKLTEGDGISTKERFSPKSKDKIFKKQMTRSRGLDLIYSSV